jgi:hypothetical protein
MLLFLTWKLDFRESTFSCTVSVGTSRSVDCEQKLVFLKLIKENPFKLDCNKYTVLSSPAFLMVDIVIIVIVISLFVCLFFVCFLGVTTHCGCIFYSPVAGFSLLVFRGLLITYDAPQSVGLLWTSDQSVAETST